MLNSQLLLLTFNYKVNLYSFKYIPLSFHQTKQIGVIYSMNTNGRFTNHELIIGDEPGLCVMQVADSVYQGDEHFILPENQS